MTDYEKAQRAVAELKAAIYGLLEHTKVGLTNAEIGRSLGIYEGHVGHEGHIPRTLLAWMEREGVVHQDTSKRWSLRRTLESQLDQTTPPPSSYPATS